MGNNKIFEIGTIKTGTTSLGKALELLGYNMIGFNLSQVRSLKMNGEESLLPYINKYDAFQDAPWHNISLEFLTSNFPDAKYISLERDDEMWFKSLIGHIKRKDFLMGGAGVQYQKYLKNPEGFKIRMLSKKRAKYQKINSFFASSPEKLLTMNICDNGDGWETLCEFLEQPVPDVKFPCLFTAERAWEITHKRKAKMQLPLVNEDKL